MHLVSNGVVGRGGLHPNRFEAFSVGGREGRHDKHAFCC